MYVSNRLALNVSCKSLALKCAIHLFGHQMYQGVGNPQKCDVGFYPLNLAFSFTFILQSFGPYISYIYLLQLFGSCTKNWLTLTFVMQLFQAVKIYTVFSFFGKWLLKYDMQLFGL